MRKPNALVVSRNDDRVIIMLPERDGDDRDHAVVTEDEAFCLSSALRRMVPSRDRRTLEVGDIGTGVRIERVDHPFMPIEIHVDDDGGTTIVDLTRDDALGVADMLWAAHRSTGSFHAITTIAGGIRRKSHLSPDHAVVPMPDGPEMIIARLVGGIRRRARGEKPETKT